jgi:EpsI family protein
VSSNRRLLRFLGIGLVILALGPLATTYLARSVARIDQVTLPQIPNCQALNGWAVDWTPTFVGPDFAVADSFQCNGYRLHVNVVQYVEQRQGKEAINDLNSVVPRSWWNNTTRTRRSVADNFDVDEFRVAMPSSRLTIWNWYAVGVRPVASGTGAKFLEAINALTLRGSVTSNLTVAVEADPNFEATDALTLATSSIWKWFTTAMNLAG